MIAESLLGVWLFTNLIYQGNTLPPPNPSLKIYFQFEDSGVDTLTYYREGEHGFCERRAQYSYDDQKLSQQITWVNPDNAEWCSQDTDMQMGNRSTTSTWFEEGRLHMQFQMGEEVLIYVWDRQPAKSWHLNKTSEQSARIGWLDKADLRPALSPR